MKQSIVLLSILALFSTANASDVKKVFDGTQAYCSEPVDSPYTNSAKVVRSHIDGDDLVIEMSTCVNGKWALDQNLKTNKYKSFTGVSVIENYFGFVIYVKSIDGKVEKAFKLNHFESSSSARIALSDLSKVSTAAFDINLQSSRKTQASNGYRMTDEVKWGALRVVLK